MHTVIKKTKIDHCAPLTNKKDIFYDKYGLSDLNTKINNDADFNKNLDKLVVFDYMKPQMKKQQLSLLLHDIIEAKLVYDQTLIYDDLDNKEVLNNDCFSNSEEHLELPSNDTQSSFNESEKYNNTEETNLMQDLNSSQLNILYEKFIET